MDGGDLHHAGIGGIERYFPENAIVFVTIFV